MTNIPWNWDGNNHGHCLDKHDTDTAMTADTLRTNVEAAIITAHCRDKQHWAANNHDHCCNNHNPVRVKTWPMPRHAKHWDVYDHITVVTIVVYFHRWRYHSMWCSMKAQSHGDYRLIYKITSTKNWYNMKNRYNIDGMWQFKVLFQSKIISDQENMTNKQKKCPFNHIITT